MIGWIVRRARRRDDEGLGVIFVIFISLMVLIMLGTASAALVDQIKPAAESVNLGLATAAAEAGIDDAVGWLNTNCGSPDGLVCDTATPTVGQTVSKTLGTSSHESFTWKVLAFVAGKMRVTSTGRALGPAAHGVQPTLKSTTLVADITATPSFTNFQYYTKYETFPADFVNSFYGARTVQVTSAANAQGSSLSSAGTITWNGTCSYDATTNPTCDQNHSTDICNDLYFPTANGLGRSTDSAWNNSVRRPSSTTQAAMGTDSTFAYYSESGTFAPTTGSTSNVTHNDTCDSTFEPNMVMNGPIYSQDAYLIDRGKDTGNSKNSMPVFSDTAYSMWNGQANGVQQSPGPNGGYARAYPNTNGQISTTVAQEPVYTTDELELPANANGAQSLATCTYTGPTRILIKQGYAYITSPMTPTSPAPTGPSYCYTSTGSFTNTNAVANGGVANAQVPINSTLIYIANPTASSHPVATKSTPIFSLSSSIAAPAATGSNTLAGTWTDGSTYSSTQDCPTNAPTKERNFDCETSAASPATDMKTAISSAVNAALRAGASSASALQTNVKAAITGLMSATSLTQPATYNRTNGYYYKVTVGTPTQTSTTTNPPTYSPTTETLYQKGSTGSFTTTTSTMTISIDRMTCSASKKGVCSSETDTPILKGTGTGSSSSGSTAATTETWPWFGAQTGATTYTDPNNDITQYQSNWGDAYVQGQLTGEMTIIAEHDIVATNDITYTDTDVSKTTDGLALVADHNARIYRPMTCTDDGTAGQTTGGFCPNDLTGVYSTALSWPLPTNYPSLKYTPDNAPSMTGTATGSGSGQLDATVFTLRGCFMIDNWYRGGIGVGANVTGGLYQYHRGPTSLPYQGRPYQGSTTKMPGVTLTYTYDDMRAQQNLKNGLRVPWVPNPQGRPSTSSRTWNTVAISTGS